MTKPGVRAAVLAVLVSVGLPAAAAAQRQEPSPNVPQSAQGSLSVSPADEQALKDLVTRFYEARAGKDMATYTALWFSKAPRRPFPNYPPEYAFPYSRLEFQPPAFSRLVNRTAFVTARVTVHVMVTAQPDDKARAGVWVRNMQFMKESDEWKVYGETPAADDLASDIVRAQTVDARQQLLVSEPDLVNEELALSIEREGDRLVFGGNFAGAMAIFQLEMNLAEQVKSVLGVTRAHLKIGHVLQIGRNPDAATHLLKALEGFTTLGDRREIARTQIALGSAYYMVDDQASRDHYKAGVDILETLPDKVEFAQALHGYGNACYMTGNFNEATDAYQRSMDLQRAAGVTNAIPLLLQALGRVQKEQGDYDAALESYEKSMADVTLLDNTIVFGGRSGKADVYRLQGRFDLALEEYGALLALVKGWDDPQSLMRLEADIGTVYISEQQPASALDHYQQSLDLAEQLKNQAGMARAVSGAGAAYFANQQLEQSLDAFNRGLALYETLRDKGSTAWSWAHIAMVQSAREKHDEALAACQKALDLCLELNDRAAASAMLVLQAMEHLGLEHYDQTIDLADQAATMARAMERYDTLAQARLVKGNALRKKNDTEGARAMFTEAIAAVETARAQAGEEPRDDFFGDNRGPYRAMALLLADGGSATDALVFAERSQLGLLSNILAGNRSLLTAGMAPKEREQERQLNRTRKSLRTQLEKERERPTVDVALNVTPRGTTASRSGGTRLDDLKARLADLEQQRAAFYEKLYAANPTLKLQRGFVEAAGVNDFAALVPDAKTAVLEFVASDTQSLLIALTRPVSKEMPVARTSAAKSAASVAPAAPAAAPDVHVYLIDVKILDLARRIRDFRALVAARDKTVDKAARDLYDLLLAPARDVLVGRTRLIVVPDGPLWGLPFQALQGADGKYVIQTAALSYAPSLTTLALVQSGALTGTTASTSTVPAPEAARARVQVVAVGNAQPGTAAERMALLQPKASMKPMPNAEQEVRKLPLLYGLSRVKVHASQITSLENICAEARTAAAFHLATFVVPSAASPLRSPIVLSSPGNGKPTQTIEAWELLNNCVSPRVVISRVQSDRGVAEASIPVGLAWALAVGGARSTVLATWPDDSAGAVATMTGLHRALAQPRPTPLAMPAALRQAILPMLATEFRHPFYWANYSVIGIY